MTKPKKLTDTNTGFFKGNIMIPYLLGVATGLLVAWLEYRIHTRKLAAEQRWLERVFHEDND